MAGFQCCFLLKERAFQSKLAVEIRTVSFASVLTPKHQLITFLSSRCAKNFGTCSKSTK